MKTKDPMLTMFRKDTAIQYRLCRRLLKGNPPLDEVIPPSLHLWDVLRTVVTLALFLMAGCSDTPAIAQKVDMKAISHIESWDNPRAYNPNSGATGMYQITQVVVDDFNRSSASDGIDQHLTLNDMFNPDQCENVAQWYLDFRIPQLLHHYHIKDTIVNRLWAYNAGIKNVRRHRMPEQTKNYIVQYQDFESERGLVE